MIPTKRVENINPRTVPTTANVLRRAPSKERIPGDNYTIPRVRYRYERVSWEIFLDNTYDTYKTVRSSFIPYTVINDEYYWLLGSFFDYPRDILADFGGSCIVFDPPVKYLQKGARQMRNYQHAFGCAMLELNEESK